MSLISATTGHNPKEEKQVARILYIALAIAVIVGFSVAMGMSRHRNLDPANSQPNSQMGRPTDSAVTPETNPSKSQ